jgi:peptidyl-prolyl cis-trans isomerase C
MSPRLRLLRLAVLWCAAAAFVGPMAGPVAAQQPATPAQTTKPAPPATAPAPAATTPPATPAKPAATTPAPAQTQAAPPAAGAAPLKDPVVAIVNGQPLHLSELEIAQQSLPQQYRNMPMAAVFPALLDRIIDSKLVVQDGRKNKVTDDVAYKKRMAFVEEQVVQDFWLQKQIAAKVTPEKMRAKYEERLKSMPSEEEVHARHILVATEDEAKAIIADLKKGTDFEKLAKDKSTDKASGAEGGDLGWFKKADMVKEFADAAFALKKDALTDTPVKTQFGYHVIRLDDRRQAPPPSFDEMAEQIREEMAREAVTAMLNELRSGAKIEKFNIDGSKPAPATPAAPPAAPGAAPAKPAAPAK